MTSSSEMGMLKAALDRDAEQMRATGLVPAGGEPLAAQAANAITALLSRIEMLEEALKPFADRSGGFLGNVTDEDVARARSALAANRSGG